MPHVVFWRTTDKGQVYAGEFTVIDGKIVSKDVGPGVLTHLHEGVVRGIKPSAGDAFMRACVVEFSGSYFRAEYFK